MERNRESRRGTSSVIGGSFSSSRRRLRSIGLRDSSGVCDAEDVGVSDSVRDRFNGKKERTSRRRLSSNGRYHVDRDEENGSSDESLDDADNDEEDEHVRGSGTGGSSRRMERAKHPQFKGPDEVIGVSVPRRVRSASVKRFQDSFSNVRRLSSSSLLQTIAASPSPPSLNAATKATRKMVKPTTKVKPSKTSKVSISESEVEVAHFLYGLTRLQSHQSPAKSDAFQSPSQVDHNHNPSNEGSIFAPSKTSSPGSIPLSPPSSQPAFLPQNSSFMSTTVTVPKRKKPRIVQLDDGDDSTMMACSCKPSVCCSIGNNSNSSIPTSSPKTEGNIGSPARRAEVLSPKSDKNTISNEGDTSKPETSLPVSSPSSPSSTSLPENLPMTEAKPNTESTLESKTSMSLEKNFQTPTLKAEEAGGLEVDLQASFDVVEEESSSAVQDISAPLISDVKRETPNITSPGSAAAESTKVVKFEIDLMAPPKNDDDVLVEVGTNATQTSISDIRNPVVREAISETEGQVEADEASPKHNPNVLALEQNMQMKETMKMATLKKQFHNENKGGSSNADDQNHLYNSDNKQPSQKLLRISARSTDRTDLPVGTMASISNPIPVTVPSWPGGLPPFGYLGSSLSNLSGLQAVQATLPKEGNCAIPSPPFMMVPQARPSRCATHCFIARLIHYQQQTARLNPFWHAAGSAALYGGKPYNLNLLPPSESILYSAGSVVRNPNMVPNGNLGPGSVMALNDGRKSTDKLPNSADNRRKPSLLPQSAHQMPTFIFPFTQSRASGIKFSNGMENASLASASSGSAAAPSASVNSNFSKTAANSDQQYLAMLHSSYSFPMPAAYRAHMTQQQQPGAPFFGGSLYPAHLLHLQSHMLPHTYNQKHSTSSVSLSKPSAEFSGNEAELVRDQQGGSEVQVLPARELPGQNVTGLPNFHQNYAIIPPSFNGNPRQQQPGDPNLPMSLKGMEAAAGSFPSGYSTLQTMPNLGLHQYRIGGGHIPIQAANQSKGPSKSSASVTVSDKFPAPFHTQLLPVSAKRQRQKQVVAQTRPLDSSVTAAGGSSGLDHTDHIPAGYLNAGTNFPVGTMGFPQWNMLPSDRVAPGALPGNFFRSSMAMAVAAVTQNAGSSVVKASRVASPHMNPTRIAPSSGPSVMALSDQAQSQPKTQLLYFSSEPADQNSGSNNTLSSQMHSAEMTSARRTMFQDSLNLRTDNQQSQPSLTVGGTGAYLGGGKNPAVFGHPLAGSSVAVMAVASYAQSAVNLPMKSAEQKPAEA